MKVETKTKVDVTLKQNNQPHIDTKVMPTGFGCLDMVIAFDTTGSMSAYIDDVRHQVKEMIPRLFRENEDLQLGIVAFGDYCDMENASTFGAAYQCMPLTNNENDLIRFVQKARNTSGGDGDEFYELVLQKIISEMPWREGSVKTILLIADAEPHRVGYTYEPYVINNQIDWRAEARRAAAKMIRIDTVSIHGSQWYYELSAMTNGICVPFKSSGNTATMIETAATARAVMSHECRRKVTGEKMSEREHFLRTKLEKMRKANATNVEMDGTINAYMDTVDE